MKISILPPSQGQVAACVQLDRELGLQSWDAAAYARCAADPESDLLVAASAEGIEGFYLARSLGDCGEILKIGVRRASQGQGIGTALMRAGLAEGRRRGWKTCFLEVRAGNRAARVLYASLGFERVGRRAGYYREPDDDAEVLALQLDALPTGRAPS